MQAIRDILLLGHRQAFTWIDEWFGKCAQWLCSDRTENVCHQMHVWVYVDNNKKTKKWFYSRSFISAWVPPRKHGFLQVNPGSFRSTRVPSGRVSRQQISRKFTSHTVSAVVITMRLFTSQQSPSFLQSIALDACKCKHFKSLSTTSFQVFLGLPLGQSPSIS